MSLRSLSRCTVVESFKRFGTCIVHMAIRIDEIHLKAVDDITPEEQSVIVRELEPHVLRCVKDANGNHVSLLRPSSFE
jgi:hypothetical protein